MWTAGCMWWPCTRAPRTTARCPRCLLGTRRRRSPPRAPARPCTGRQGSRARPRTHQSPCTPCRPCPCTCSGGEKRLSNSGRKYIGRVERAGRTKGAKGKKLEKVWGRATERPSGLRQGLVQESERGLKGSKRADKGRRGGGAVRGSASSAPAGAGAALRGQGLR
eukprot:2408463-Pyramimonas_sp.AAC.2